MNYYAPRRSYRKKPTKPRTPETIQADIDRAYKALNEKPRNYTASYYDMKRALHRGLTELHSELRKSCEYYGRGAA